MRPLLDLGLIREHPKVFLGYSDTTVTHLAFLEADVTSFYGPSLMSGVAELANFPYAETWLRKLLLEGWHGPYAAAQSWAELKWPKTLHPGSWK